MKFVQCWFHAVFLLGRVNLPAVALCSLPIFYTPTKLTVCIANKVDDLLPFLRTLRPALKAYFLALTVKKILSLPPITAGAPPTFNRSPPFKNFKKRSVWNRLLFLTSSSNFVPPEVVESYAEGGVQPVLHR